MASQDVAVCCSALDAVLADAWVVQRLMDGHTRFLAEHDTQCKVRTCARGVRGSASFGCIVAQ
jgi:hypothetical protein